MLRLPPAPQSPRHLEGGGRLGLEVLVLYWPSRLLEGNEAGGVGGSNARPAMLHRLVGDGELAQVVTDHLGLWR